MMYCSLSHYVQSLQFLHRTHKGPGQFYHCPIIKCSTCFFPHRCWIVVQLPSIQLEPGQSITPYLQSQKIFKFEICLLLHFHSTFSKPNHFSTNQESWIIVNTTPPTLNSMLNPSLSQRPVRTYELSLPEGLQIWSGQVAESREKSLRGGYGASPICLSTWKKRHTDGAASSDRTRVNGLKHRRLPGNNREHFCTLRASKHWHSTGSPVKWRSLHWRYSKYIQTQFWVSCCNSPAWAKGD